MEADDRTKAVPLMALHKGMEHRTIIFVQPGESARRNFAQKIAKEVAGFFVELKCQAARRFTYSPKAGRRSSASLYPLQASAGA